MDKTVALGTVSLFVHDYLNGIIKEVVGIENQTRNLNAEISELGTRARLNRKGNVKVQAE